MLRCCLCFHLDWWHIAGCPPPPPRPRAFFRLRSPTTAAYTPHAAREVSAGKPRHVNGKLPCMSNRTPCSSCTSPASHASPAAGSSSGPDPGCAMLRPETQEGGCFGLDPSGFEIPRVRLQGGCPHQAVRSRDDRGIDRELGTMPHGQAIGDWRGQGERREHTAHGPHKVLLARAAAHETQDRGEKGASRRRAHHKRKRQRVGTHARFLLRPELAVGPVQHVSPQSGVGKHARRTPAAAETATGQRPAKTRGVGIRSRRSVPPRFVQDLVRP